MCCARFRGVGNIPRAAGSAAGLKADATAALRDQMQQADLICLKVEAVAHRRCTSRVCPPHAKQRLIDGLGNGRAGGRGRRPGQRCESRPRGFTLASLRQGHIHRPVRLSLPCRPAAQHRLPAMARWLIKSTPATPIGERHLRWRPKRCRVAEGATAAVGMLRQPVAAAVFGKRRQIHHDHRRRWTRTMAGCLGLDLKASSRTRRYYARVMGRASRQWHASRRPGRASGQVYGQAAWAPPTGPESPGMTKRPADVETTKPRTQCPCWTRAADQANGRHLARTIADDP